MNLKEEIRQEFLGIVILEEPLEAIEQLIKREQKKCLEAFAEDVKENVRYTFNSDYEQVISERSIDEIKQKYIDKL